MKIKAAVVWEKGAPFVIEEVELAQPRTGELLVKVTASGFCHTDEAARNQNPFVPLPAVLGHEGCGVVEKIGEGVKDFQPGDHVVFSFGFCGICENCLAGMPARCGGNTEMNFHGVYPDGMTRLSKDGKPLTSFFGQSSFADYALVNERSAVAVPEDVPLEITGPLGCGIQTGAGAVLNRLKPRPGSALVVLGCGGVGMSAIMAAKIAGCGMIIGVDIVQSRLDMALNLGATHVINSKNTPSVDEEVFKITGGGAHYSVDTTGRGDCVRTSLRCTRIGGTTVVVGTTGEMTMHVSDDLMGMSRSLIGVIEGDSVPKLFVPELLGHYKAGRFPFDKLITFYDFEDINAAAADSHSGKVIKAVLRMT